MPALVGALQLDLSRASAHQIRFEEIAESVRNVYWLDHRLIYDGISSNVGWYGTLLAVYKTIGFSLLTAKWVRLAIFVAGLSAAAATLRRVLSPLATGIVLLAVGLSPTLLYFNTLQTSFGLDVPYAAICLWIVLSLNAGSTTAMNAMRATAAGAVAMLAALSYPAFLLYLPSLVLVGCWRLMAAGRSWSARSVIALAATAGAAAPLVASLAYVSNPTVLLFDPDTRTGVFRGGGHFGFDPAAFGDWIVTLGRDLFVRTDSYHAEISRPEFAGVVGVVAVAIILGLAAYRAVVDPEDRRLLWPVWLLLLMTLVMPGLSVGGSPGLRRGTAVVAVIAALLAVLWRSIGALRRKDRWARGLLIAASLLLVADHAAKVPSLRADLLSPSQFRNVDWYARMATPSASLDDLVRQTADGRALSCPIDEANRIRPCRYQDIYPALAGAREWGGGPARDVVAIDWRSGRPITLTPQLWATHYYPH